tara:strand:- start:36264 stop:36800 length:537 start_codon:yes stop_codon:yes gene_type:complete
MKRTTIATLWLYLVGFAGFHPANSTATTWLAFAACGFGALAIAGARKRHPARAERSALRVALLVTAGAGAAIYANQAWGAGILIGLPLTLAGLCYGLASADSNSYEDDRLGWLHLFVADRLKASTRESTPEQPRYANSPSNGSEPPPKRHQNEFANGFTAAMTEVNDKLERLRQEGRL